MKDCESIGRSNKRAKSRTLGGTKLKNSPSSSSLRKSNGTTVTTKSSSSPDKRRSPKAKAMMGANSSKSPAKSNNNSTGAKKKNGSPKKGSKQSPKLRPRRRASQTYFFKYQLAKNPLKAEEEDLKLALLASLQQCPNDSGVKNKLSTPVKKAKNCKNSIQSTSESKKQHARRPSKSSDDLSSDDEPKTTYNGGNCKKNEKVNSKKGQQYKICANFTNGNKRRGSVESNLSSISSSLRDEDKKIKHKQNGSLLTDCSLKTKSTKSKKPRSKVKNSVSTCNDLTSVQNKIKKAKKLLQNKQANKNSSNAIIGKYSALRKFPSNTNNVKRQGENSSLNNKSKGKSKFNKHYYSHYNNDNNNAHLSSTANFNTTSRNQYYIPYSPYTPLQKKEPPDEDYLKKYKPETEDFLTFICFRTTAPNYQNKPTADVITNGFGEDTSSTTTTIITSNQGANSHTNSRLNDKSTSNDAHNLIQRPQSPNKTTNNTNGSPTIDFRYKIYRPPTRSSPRLASSSKKISEKEGLFHSVGTSSTACDNSMTYEEDMKRASIALEDMAQEINSSDGIKNEIAQDSPDCISKSFTSPYKNNKHLVKGLMTREFAGAFADEETIFESISNHKL